MRTLFKFDCNEHLISWVNCETDSNGQIFSPSRICVNNPFLDKLAEMGQIGIINGVLIYQEITSDS